MRMKLLFVLVVSFCQYTCVLFAANLHEMKGNRSFQTVLTFDQIKKAAQNGDADAQYALGYIYYYGKDGALKDPMEARKWIEKAAEHGQPQAVKALSLMNRQQNSQAPEQKRLFSSDTAQSLKSDVNVVTSKEPYQHDKMDRRRVETNSLVEKHLKRINEERETVNYDSGFTLQLLGSYQKELVEKVRVLHHLNHANIYRTNFKNKDWYVLLQGRYKTRTEAKLAAKEFEQELAIKPWIKPYASLKTYKRCR